MLFLENAHGDTVSSWEGNGGLAVLSDDVHVVDSGGEVVASGISQVHNIEASQMSALVEDLSDSSSVVSGGDESQGSCLIQNQEEINQFSYVGDFERIPGSNL